jgi:hypothetical protein
VIAKAAKKTCLIHHHLLYCVHTDPSVFKETFNLGDRIPGLKLLLWARTF